MRKTIACALGCALLLATLTGCGGGTAVTGPTYSPPATYTPSTTVESLPPFTTYQVPNGDCPSNYGIGLSITTDTAAEVRYLEDIVACTDPTGSVTYLKNKGDAVWTLTNIGSTAGAVQRWDEELVASSFPAIIGAQQTLMVPGGQMTVNLPPAQVRWDLDLALSIDWQGYGVVVDKIKSAGEDALITALRRRSPARAALTACTLGIDETARDVSDLGDADLTEVVLTGLGTATTTSKCRQAAAAVQAVDETGRVVTLSDELGQLARQTSTLEHVESRLGYVASGYKALRFIELAWIH